MIFHLPNFKWLNKLKKYTIQIWMKMLKKSIKCLAKKIISNSLTQPL